MSALLPAREGSPLNATAAVLRIDGLDLMFQPGEVRTLEAAAEVDGREPKEKSVGWIGYLRQRWPVYCVSEQLELLDRVPASRTTCALLAMETGYIGVLCDDVSMKQVAGRRYELPVAMKTAATPILGLLAHDRGLLCVSSANRLAAYVAHQTAAIELNKG